MPSLGLTLGTVRHLAYSALLPSPHRSSSRPGPTCGSTTEFTPQNFLEGTSVSPAEITTYIEHTGGSYSPSRKKPRVAVVQPALCLEALSAIIGPHVQEERMPMSNQ